MSGLSDPELITLGFLLDNYHADPSDDERFEMARTFVEQTVARHVAAALTAKADEIEAEAETFRMAAEVSSVSEAAKRHRLRRSGLRIAARIVRPT